MFKLLWSISIVGGAFEQKGGEKLQHMRGNHILFKGTNLTVVARRHPFISPA